MRGGKERKGKERKKKERAGKSVCVNAITSFDEFCLMMSCTDLRKGMDGKQRRKDGGDPTKGSENGVMS